jgi:hypothetical protein
MMNTLRTDKNALQCYHDFLSEVNKIEDEARREACKLGPGDFKCECCETAPGHIPPEAHLYKGAVYICANNPSVRSRDADLIGRMICHELVHRLQGAPCKAGAQPPEGITSCTEVIKREMEAYYCAGLAELPNGRPDIPTLLKLVAESAKYSPACNAQNYVPSVQAALKWSATNLKKENCPITYPGPPYAPKL